MGTRTLGRRRR
uniref:Uncharacterized protein n=1 Tax=Arundo donax TaxID=35708 RepID=A0A0A9AZM4_ARUDO